MNRVLLQSPSFVYKVGTALAAPSLSLASPIAILSFGYGSPCYWTSKMKIFSVRLPLIRGFTACFASQDLAIKRCVPCNSKDIRSMTEQSANEWLPRVPDWNLLSEGGTMKLQRSWKVKSFTKGLEFFQLVADVAEAEGHHPDLHLVGWNNLKIDIWTHSVGGLTENDFILAAKINVLKLEHLLRNKTPS